MDNKKTADFVNAMWDDSIIPEISEYIKVPNKSPAFDPDFEVDPLESFEPLLQQIFAQPQKML